MRNNFRICFEKLLEHEGGYSKAPHDLAGATNYGITIHDVKRFINPNANDDDVKELTIGQAEEIYKEHYWDFLKCDDIPSGLDYSIFDFGVNSGVGRSARIVRHIFSIAPTPTLIDDLCLELLRRTNPIKFIKRINLERIKFLKALGSWNHFGVGWERRVHEVESFSLQLTMEGKINV